MATLRSAAISFRSIYANACLDRHAFHTTAITNGIVDNVKSAYDEARGATEEKRTQKIFETQLSYLRGKELITPQVFKSLLQEMKVAAGMSGIREHLPWVQNNPALGEFKEQESIISAMTLHERKDAFSIKISDKKRLARETKAPMESVEALVSQITQMRRIQKWMWKREEANLPIPTSPIELERMISATGGIKQGKKHNDWPNPGVPEKKRGRGRRKLW
ncbi:unnamed protein product [Agarophyton chilense]|eukprot:gb/GEZJ01003713.1/.p1 GENE.gb/GEZJ01003713.1/~~gb/GEZJ01003713.1/.p1  ORF type:complete len:220 (+),score=33.49 gb/GEZJ01003713.1/:439-1098(+)